jgi:hypothetical protein
MNQALTENMTNLELADAVTNINTMGDRRSFPSEDDCLVLVEAALRFRNGCYQKIINNTHNCSIKMQTELW